MRIDLENHVFSKRMGNKNRIITARSPLLCGGGCGGGTGLFLGEVLTGGEVVLLGGAK